MPLPSHAEQCRFDTSPCKAPAVRYHSEQCDSFAVPCRAVPRHCLSFDALPQQIISQPRDAIALQFRGDSWQVSALPMHHSAHLAFPLLAGAMLLPMLRFSWLCRCGSFPGYAPATRFRALPLLFRASLCLRCSAGCFAIAILRKSRPRPRGSVPFLAIAWLRKRNYRNPQKYGSQEQMDTKT